MSVHVKGLAEFQRALRDVDNDLPKELRKAHKDIAEFIKDKAQARARSGSAQQAKAAPGIRAGAEQRRALLKIGGARNPFAIGAFFGARKYKQFPKWVGNQWQPGDHGGPLIIGPVLADNTEEVIDRLDAMVAELSRKAFPD